LSKDSLEDNLNEIINHYLTEMMNAYRSSRNAWISLEKDKAKNRLLLEKAKTSSLNEILNSQVNILRNDGSKPKSNSFIPLEILEKDKHSLSYEETIKKVEDFMEKSKSQGYNKFVIGGDYSVSFRGIDNNRSPNQITLNLPQREYVYWSCYNFLDKLQTRINYQAKMILVFQFSFFEKCLKDLTKKIYESKPELLRSSIKKTDDSETTQEFIKLLNKEVDWWGRNSIDKIANRINRRFNINLMEDFAKWKELREAYYIRNIVVHNSGVVDERLCKDLEYDTSRIGEILDISTDYIEKIYPIIRGSLILIRDGLVLLVS